jgi:hypothetical protein
MADMIRCCEMLPAGFETNLISQFRVCVARTCSDRDSGNNNLFSARLGPRVTCNMAEVWVLPKPGNPGLGRQYSVVFAFCATELRSCVWWCVLATVSSTRVTFIGKFKALLMRAIADKVDYFSGGTVSRA